LLPSDDDDDVDVRDRFTAVRGGSSRGCYKLVDSQGHRLHHKENVHIVLPPFYAYIY